MARSVLWVRAGRIAFVPLACAAVGACSLVTETDDLTSGDPRSSRDSGSEPGHIAGADAQADASSSIADASLDDAFADDTGIVDSSTIDTSTADAAPLNCTGGKVACKGSCVDLTAPTSCGACGNVCASGVCGTSILEAMATKPSLWTFNGDAVWNSSAPSAMLTAPNVPHQAGSVIYNHPIAADAFSIAFQFRIGLLGGTRTDGMGFLLQKTGVNAVGGDGSGLGMAGLQGYGVEFDIFNGGVCGDTSDDHIGIDTLNKCNNGQPTSIASTDITGTLDLGDTHWHTATVTLASGALTLTLDGNVYFSGTQLPSFTPGDAYYIGFAAATGGLVDSSGNGGFRQEVKNVAITFPSPHCL